MGHSARHRWLARVGLDRPEARAWALYDWANSAVYTTVIVAIFPVYFDKVLASELDADQRSRVYALATTIALIGVAVLAPFLGALADVKASKKRFLAIFAGLGALATAALFWAEAGEWRFGLACFVLLNVGAASSLTFYDALLPHVAPPGQVDLLSSVGYAAGYLGGGLLLALNLHWIQAPEFYGLPATGSLPTRLAFLSVAAWWVLFTLPLLRRVPEPSRTLESDERASASPWRTSLTRMGETWRALSGYRQAFLLLAAFLLYNDGILTIMRMATRYGSSRDLGAGTLIGAILFVQFLGVPCAILFGKLAGRFGAKPLLLGSLLVYSAICVYARGMQGERDFWILAAGVGLVQGGSQALSRSLFASMIPKHKSGEFFALFALGEKFAGIFGPLLWIAATELFSEEEAILSVLVFFIIGGLLLWRVDVRAGQAAAQRADADVRLG